MTAKREKKIIFFGTPEFATVSLQGLIAENYKVAAVVTAPDKPAGRGRKIRMSDVKKYALAKQLPVLQPVRLQDPAFLQTLSAYQADLFIVVAFRKLPPEVWKMPPAGTFNLHASLLPAYRGAAPIHWAIANGESETGVTTFFIDEKIDTGNIILQIKVPVTKDMNAGRLHDLLALTGKDAVIETVKRIFSGNVKTKPQPSEASSKAPKLNPENTRIDWDKPLESIYDFIRGMSPYPGARAFLVEHEKKTAFKIYAAEVERTAHNIPAGTVQVIKEHSRKKMRIAHKEGFVYPTELQFPGKRRMDIHNFLNGYPLENTAKIE